MADSSGFDWTNLIGPGLNLASSLYGASQNVGAAQTQTNASTFHPFNVNGPNGTAQFSGQNINLGQSPNSAALGGYLQNGGAGLFQNYLNQQQAPGGLNELAGEYDYANSLTNPNQALGLGSQFLGQLGSTDPNQLANSYASNLNQINQQGDNTAANSLANRLFSTGNLGSTGGANLFGQLMQQQNLAQVQRQIAGQQYGQQSQMNMANLGQGLYNNGLTQVQNRYNNAGVLFNANQQQGNQLLGGFQAALGQNNNMNSQLLGMAQLGANTGLGQSQANYQAYQPTVQAQQAQNSGIYGALGNLASGINWSGLLGGSGNYNLGGLTSLQNQPDYSNMAMPIDTSAMQVPQLYG